MYTPKHFAENNVAAMHELINKNPLATLVTLTANGLTANHIPLLLSGENTEFGVLQGHVARANQIWRDFLPEIETLAVFQSVEAYIAPGWYATKQETGKVVPTWNYAVVHAHGKLRVVDDAKWLRRQIENLTALQESESPEAWRVSDAPAEFVEKLLGAIVGVEIVITKLEGKSKVSQNQSAADQTNVVKGLRERRAAHDWAMAELIAAKAASIKEPN